VKKTQIELAKFSFFRSPIDTTIPAKEMGIIELYHLVCNPFTYGERTRKAYRLYSEYLRSGDKAPYNEFKKSSFDFCTPSGLCTYRSKTGMGKHSGYIRIDFDNLPDPAWLKNILLTDENIETDLLFFTPSGRGIAWFVSIEPDFTSHEEYYMKIGNYIVNRYNLPVECFDVSCKDICRATFISHDLECFINPKYLSL